MRTSSRVRGLPVFGFAVAGLLLGHVISYALAVPDPHDRELLLEETGHGYLPAAAEVAVILALGAVAALVARSWSGRGREDRIGFGPLALCLVVTQVAAFAGQEVTERLLSGTSLSSLLDGHLLVVGLIVQMAVAVAGAGVLRWLALAAGRISGIVAAHPALPRATPAFAVPVEWAVPSARLASSPRSLRGPPSD